jgi:hypothetical protein
VEALTKPSVYVETSVLDFRFSFIRQFFLYKEVDILITNDQQILQFHEIAGYQYKVLPLGIHQINENDFDELFVNCFPNSNSRQLIAKGFKTFRNIIQTLLPSRQWINGSFVESKLNPNDVDVVFLANYNDIIKLPDNEKQQLRDYIVNEKAKSQFFTHAFLV